MEQITYSENIPWFELGEISWYKELYYCISKEIKEYSNATFIDSYVLDILKNFIYIKLDKNNINPKIFLEDTIIVLAHWQSNKDDWW